LKRGEKLLLKRQLPIYTELLLLFLLLAFLLDNIIFRLRIHGFMGNYLLPALMWGCLVILIYKLPASRPAGKLRQQRLLRWLALMSVLIAVLCTVLEGAVAGFGKSPYDHSIMGVIINTVSAGLALIALEMARAWLINRHFSRRPFIGIPLIALFFTCFSLPFNQIVNLKSGLDLTKFVGMNFLPELGQNVLAAYLVFLGGPIPAVIYRGGLMVFERMVPVLPAANWASHTLLNTLAPVLGFMLVMQIYREESRIIRYSRGEDNPLGWVLTGLAVIVIIWFSMGVFSYSPRVILSGSMQPGINIGDIVIIKAIDGDQAQVGDIIMFPMGNMKVTHRVIDVQQRDGTKYFTTKGDANSEAERDPVSAKNVKGKVVGVIPQAGKLTILLRSGGQVEIPPAS